MLNFLINKILYSISVLFGVILVIFFLFTILPGDPSKMIMDKRDNFDLNNAIKEKYGFNYSKLNQFFFYLNDISPLSFHSTKEDSFTNINKHKYSIFYKVYTNAFIIVLKYPYLRESYYRNNTLVSEIILNTIPNTIILAFTAIFISLILGIFLGIICAIHNEKIIDNLIFNFSILGISLPSFFSAIIISWFFGFYLSEYTGLNMTGDLFEVDNFGNGEKVKIKNIFLPALTLAIRPLSVFIQLTRKSIINTLNQDFIKTAYSKGLSLNRILFVHALPNSINPIITSSSSWFASMLAGSVFVEYIYGWNGIGKEIVDSLNFLDLPMVMGAILIISFFFIIITIFTDILYYIIDPKIRFK